MSSTSSEHEASERWFGLPVQLFRRSTEIIFSLIPAYHFGVVNATEAFLNVDAQPQGHSCEPGPVRGTSPEVDR